MRLAFIGEGSSDLLLVPAIRWSVNRLRPEQACEVVPMDFRGMPVPPDGLPERISLTLAMGEWDAILIHRDSDSLDAEPRHREIALARWAATSPAPSVIPVVPVRMTEAWLLFDEHAIRSAAGNSASTVELALPTVKECARREKPKVILHDALKRASGAKGRRLAKFNVESRCHALALAISDWSPLLAMTSFVRLQDDLDKGLP